MTTPAETEWFWDGVELGLSTAKIILDRVAPGHPAIRQFDQQCREIEDKRRDKRRGIVDGEAEYQQWIIDLELASWTAIS